MALQRGKSKTDIYDQWDKLLNHPNITPEREKRIGEIRRRYIQNINNSKRGQQRNANALMAVNNGWGGDAKRKLISKEMDSKYSRNTYMGLNEG